MKPDSVVLIVTAQTVPNQLLKLEGIVSPFHSMRACLEQCDNTKSGIFDSLEPAMLAMKGE